MWECGANYCHECQAEHKERGDEPRCIVTGMVQCEKVQERYGAPGDKRPLFLYGLNYLAWRIFWDATLFSVTDPNGIPTLSNLPFVLEVFDMQLTRQQYSDLIRKIGIIYSIMREHWQSEIMKRLKNG